MQRVANARHDPPTRPEQGGRAQDPLRECEAGAEAERVNRLRYCLLGVLALAMGVVSTATAAERPNIVFLLADDLRPDAIGNPLVQTPNFNGLIREGSRFSRAIVGYPICH